MFDFIKIINGLFFDSYDAVIGNDVTWRFTMVIQIPVTKTVDITVIVFLNYGYFPVKRKWDNYMNFYFSP